MPLAVPSQTRLEKHLSDYVADLQAVGRKIEPPLHKEPQIRYLLLAGIRRLLDYFKARQQSYVPPLRSIWLTPSSRRLPVRFDDLIQLSKGSVSSATRR
jgi:hypothetical protein